VTDKKRKSEKDLNNDDKDNVAPGEVGTACKETRTSHATSPTFNEQVTMEALRCILQEESFGRKPEDT